MKTLEIILLPWRCIMALPIALIFFIACVASSGFALLALRPSLIPEIWEKIFGDTWAQIREDGL
jgi:hypothetical protein